MLQEAHSLLVFPVGLNHHALDLLTSHTKCSLLLFDDLKGSIARKPPVNEISNAVNYTLIYYE